MIEIKYLKFKILYVFSLRLPFTRIILFFDLFYIENVFSLN